MSDDPGLPPGVPSVNQIGRYLTLIALFGAARQDATPTQVETLRVIADMLKEPSTVRPLDDIARRVFWCMGPTWVPTGRWGDWIRELMAERDRGEWEPS